MYNLDLQVAYKGVKIIALIWDFSV